MDVVKTLEALTGMYGPSGFEADVADRVAELMQPLCDEVKRDSLLNVRGVKHSKVPNAPKLLVSAHMDEIGFMVTKIEDGFLRFRTIGGIDPRVLPAREVEVMTNPPLHGVITSVPPHLQTPDQSKSAFEISQLCIDVGLSDEKAKELIEIGTPVVYSEKPVVLQDKYFSGKTLDDRACVVMLLRALELVKDKDLPVELVMMASTQEEIGSKGATVGSYDEAPTWAIACDVTHAVTPDAPQVKVKFGKGVPICTGPNATRKLAKRLCAIAEKLEIGSQLEPTPSHTGTDAWPMQVAGLGAASGVISLPLRYMHTATEMISLEDLEAGAKLIAAFAEDPYGEEGEKNA